MQQVNSSSFGLVIAYLLPGFVVLWGISLFSGTVRGWLGTPPSVAPTVGGFLYVTLASIAAGLAASTVRWMVLDAIHQATGLGEPRWDFSALPERVTAFQSLIEIHYRYYQFYGNALVAVMFVYGASRLAGGLPGGFGWTDVGFAVLAVVLAAGSRDTLRKYYERGAAVLGPQKVRSRRAALVADELLRDHSMPARRRKASGRPHCGRSANCGKIMNGLVGSLARA